jgi:hypothetical protein
MEKIVSAQEAYAQIVNYINTNGGVYKNWYVGVASNVISRLFTDHLVSQVNGVWIYCYCQNDVAARSVEEALLQLGCDGGPGGGDSSSTQIYAYLKTFWTNQ